LIYIPFAALENSNYIIKISPKIKKLYGLIKKEIHVLTFTIPGNSFSVPFCKAYVIMASEHDKQKD